MSPLKQRKIRITLSLLLSTMVLLSLLVPARAPPIGLWRLISPTEYTPNPASNMHGVYMINGGTSGKGSGVGWMVGDNGFAFQWDGFSWNQAAIPPNNCQLDSVNFGGPLNPLTSITSSAGWIVGGVGPGGACAPGKGVSFFFNGVNWVEYPIPSPTPATTEVRGVFLVQSGPPGNFIHAYAVGTESGADGVFWVWNGVPGAGGAWSRCTVAGCGPVVANPVNSLYMTHCTGSPCAADDGIAVGNGGTIFRFVAGVWTPRASPTANNLNGVAMSSPTNGWAVGDSCTIIRTTDGNTWVGAVSPATCTANLRSIVMVSASEAWAVGDSDAGGPTVVHGTSLDSAPTWTRIPVNQIAVAAPIGLNAVVFAPSGGNIWAVGASGVAAFCLSNCGSVSGAIFSTTTSPQRPNLNSVFMVSDSDGFAVGDPDAAGNPTIIRWNGGTFSWTRAPAVLPLASPAALFGVYMTGSSSAWAVGGVSPGFATASTLYFDGNTWTGRTVPACGCALRSVYMISDSNSWAVGTTPGPPFLIGVIMHSTTTGGSFSTAPSTLGTPGLFSVFFDPTSGGQSGWAVGGDGVGLPVIVHTTNGGADAWPLVGLPPGIPAGVILRSVFFQDSTHGWAVGSGGGATTMLYWNGFSWTLVPITINAPYVGPLDLFGIFVLGGPPATDGWAVGVDTGTGFPVTVHYDSATNSWSTLLAPSIPNLGTLNGLALRSSTNGLAVGTQITGNPASLALVLHLDPPDGVTASGTTTTPTTSTPTTTTSSVTSVVTTTSTGTSTTSEIGTSTQTTPSGTATTSATTTQTSTMTSVETTSSVSVSTETESSTTESSTTETSAGTTSTPLQLPPIPGFPWESIVAGIIMGLGALAMARRRRRLRN